MGGKGWGGEAPGCGVGAGAAGGPAGLAPRRGPVRGVRWRAGAAALATAALLGATSLPVAAAPAAGGTAVGMNGGTLVELSGKAVLRVPVDRGGVTLGVALHGSVAYVPDGVDGRLHVVDLKNGATLALRAIPAGGRPAAVLGPRARTVYVVGPGYVRAFQATKPYLPRPVRLESAGGMALAIAPNGRIGFVAGLGRPGIDVVDLVHGTLLATLGGTDAYSSLVLADQGRELWAFSPVSGAVRVWRLPAGTTPAAVFGTPEAGFSPSALATGTTGFMQAALDHGRHLIYAVASSGLIYRFNTHTLTALAPLHTGIAAPGVPVSLVGLAVSPDGRMLTVSVEGTGRSYLLNAATGLVLHAYGPHTAAFRFNETGGAPVAPPQG